MAYKRFVKHFLKFFVHTNKKKDLNCFISSVNTKMFVRHLTFSAKKKSNAFNINNAKWILIAGLRYPPQKHGSYPP